jgi:hypothetical protein
MLEVCVWFYKDERVRIESARNVFYGDYWAWKDGVVGEKALRDVSCP